MRFLAAVLFCASLVFPFSSAQAFGGSLFQLTPAGNIEPVEEGGAGKPAVGVFQPDRPAYGAPLPGDTGAPYQVAQSTQDRRAEPPTAPGQTSSPTTAAPVTVPAGKPSGSGLSPRNWGSVFKFFEERVQLVRFNVEALFNYSEFQSGSSQGPLEGGRFSGVIAPAIRLTEDTALVVIYNASYNRDLQVFREDEGPRRRSEEQRHEFIALISQDYLKPFGVQWINRLTLSPSVFQTYAFTRQTAAEKWGNGIPLGGLQKFKGLYDYWDRGAGFEVKVLHEQGERKHTLSASVQAYQRHYRNFTSLARQLDTTSPEPKFEKDYVGLLMRAGYELTGPNAFSFRVGVSRLDRHFTEDRARVNPLVEPGVPGERRRDTTDTLDARVTYGVPAVKGLVLGLGGSVSENRSNSGFNDTLSPLPATGYFSGHYYDYWSFRIDPDVTYAREVQFPLLRWQVKGVLTLGFAYSYDRRAYRDRKAKDVNGGFRDAGIGTKDEIEVDYVQTFAPRVVFQFHKNWALLLEAKKTIAKSNFEDERVYRYDYTINSIGFGIQYRF